MKKTNRILATVALSGAALGVIAAPAQAESAAAQPESASPVGTVGAMAHPGGLFGDVAFTLAELTSGMKMPDPDAMVEQAKNSPEGQAYMKAHPDMAAHQR
ncbi:hypothetical protein GCM10009760_23180 [Kitasatospora kazusensis]|uniref:Uncharacterized protein n=1 Tax=Kitasatospora kazusensis TaxID=407974 RepID=A0ABP5L0W6_9ACTN